MHVGIGIPRTDKVVISHNPQFSFLVARAKIPRIDFSFETDCFTQILGFFATEPFELPKVIFPKKRNLTPLIGF